MISTRVDRRPENDNYRLLALYIGAADNEGEKLLYRWHVGCSSEEFDLAIKEVEAVQNLNTRTIKEKTYHLVISFRPQDEVKLTEEVFRDIERTFAAALGFEEHQRHCGVHKNTANMHMHVAYNMIHPEKHTKLEPYRDYFKRDAACRELERKYGLVIDVPEQSAEQEAGSRKGPVRGNDKARIVESHTGQQSFDSYVLERAQALLEGFERAQSWRDFHQVCAGFGIVCELRGNGCVFRDRHGKHAAKGSRVDRRLAKASLEKRFGPYVSAGAEVFPEHERYAARPLQHGPNRHELYQEYLRCKAARKEALEAIEAESTARTSEIRKVWAHHRHKAETMSGLVTADRIELLKRTTQREQNAMKRLREEMQARRDAVRSQAPFWNWAGFLQARARDGDEMALAILRSRGEEVKPEAETAQRSPNPKLEGLAALRQRWREERQNTRKRYDLTTADKKGLLASSRMYQIISEDKLLRGASNAEGFTWTVDAKGTVLYRLPSGGLIRDDGKTITYSVHDPASKDLAVRLARLKFGREFSEVGNCLQRGRGVEKGVER